MLTLVVDDRPGVFSRVAGVLAMHGVDVVAATVHSNAQGAGLEEFRVERALDEKVVWAPVIEDLGRALAGTLDVRAEVERRARTYAHIGSAQQASPIVSDVHVDNELSSTATVIDVHTEDRVGVLFRITDVLARHGLDILSAKVQTMGARVVDAFYVRDAKGQKIVDDGTLRAIRDDVLAAVASPG
jgi:[protein-PII] uridylyltransferase